MVLSDGPRAAGRNAPLVVEVNQPERLRHVAAELRENLRHGKPPTCGAPTGRHGPCPCEDSARWPMAGTDDEHRRIEAHGRSDQPAANDRKVGG